MSKFLLKFRQFVLKHKGGKKTRNRKRDKKTRNRKRDKKTRNRKRDKKTRNRKRDKKTRNRKRDKKTKNRRNKSKLRKTKSKLKFTNAMGKKPPSSLSVFPDKSPQLQEPGEPTKLNPYTTKNVSLRDEKNNEYNAIINGRLAYRRAPRGQNIQDFSDIIYGPVVKQVDSTNYKKLKKGNKLYYDRGSVVMRGPFIFKGMRRGPELLLEVGDAVYNKKYLFTISTKKLKNEKIYMITTKDSNKNNKT